MGLRIYLVPLEILPQVSLMLGLDSDKTGTLTSTARDLFSYVGLAGMVLVRRRLQIQR
jgi:hypothetical protein